MSINRVIISGNLTKDPTVRSAASTTVLQFSVAVNDRRKNASGQWENFPNYIDCVCFGSRADRLANIMRKGMKVTVEGKLHWSQWEKDGQKRSRIDVWADDVELPPKGAQEQPADSIYDTDIPF